MARVEALLANAVSDLNGAATEVEVDWSPSWSALRRAADKVAADKGEWGGAPIPVSHARLIMEPRYPFPGLNGFKLPDKDKPAEPGLPVGIPDGFKIINRWHDYRRGATIAVIRTPEGKSTHGFMSESAGRRLEFWLDTLGIAAGEVWDCATEANALDKLKSLVTPHAMRCYMLCGCFLETSKRSGVTYMFRKLRPTIALRPNPSGMMGVIAVLCLHPLGYYEETWAGVMCPTDDVIAHLMLMRGDEHWFWKKANHHEMHWATAGI